MSEYVRLLLSDSNLPTGGFIASAGLESFAAHGLLTQCALDLHGIGVDNGQAPPPTATAQNTSAFLSFVGSSLDSYARAALPFLADAHRLTLELRQRAADESKERRINTFLHDFARLDDAYHSMVLNHVARRASCAQGIAFLTLYSKAFARAPDLASPLAAAARSRSELNPLAVSPPSVSTLLAPAIDALKLHIRRGHTPGHLPLSFGVFAAALGLGLGLEARTDHTPSHSATSASPDEHLHLHLFLQARALVSTGVRLNLFGPYLAHQMLLFHVQPLVNATLDGVRSTITLTSGLLRHPPANGTAPHTADGDEAVRDRDLSQGWAWDWADDGAWGTVHPGLRGAPATTWPLGEIAQARHDQLQSRLFNS